MRKSRRHSTALAKKNILVFLAPIYPTNALLPSFRFMMPRLRPILLLSLPTRIHPTELLTRVLALKQGSVHQQNMLIFTLITRS